ncbi:uncharacterized protein LOC110104278 [Dendrobium catenatum]|uniref:uncharacterized protein LOC110104278 n=1 Tax=Dendrobium catenatum TaxID=906689 RepID=UPI0009F48843|nr:uncharacterized protein LOC110104278 [Dendrobium catenatum]
MTSIIFWNCRGARKKQTGHFLRNIVCSNKVMFVGLVETMVEDMSRKDVDALIGPCWDFVHFHASGRSGGLLALWRNDKIQFEMVRMFDQALVGHLVFPTSEKWCLAVVYAGKDYHTRRGLWEVLSSCIDDELPVIVGGDFNYCLDQCEKKGGRRFGFPVGAQEMAAFLIDNDLHDLGFIGPNYTWSNNKTGNSKIWVRLDRVLMNSVDIQLAPLALVRHMLRVVSDHCPLLLRLACVTPSSGCRRIRFEDTWRTYPATWKLVQKLWTKNDFGRPDEVLNRKCSRTLRGLFFCSRNRMKELDELKVSLEARIGELQLLECTPEGLSPVQDVELRRAAAELNSTLARLAMRWRQRAKARWIEEGDSNSHFFHAFASTRR